MTTPENSDNSNSFNDLTNTRIGDYQILRKIGSGAMADVYLAQQISLGRRVALKFLKPEFSQDETYLKRFVREAQAAARLVHPNIVHIYEVGESQELHYIAQEYVPGTNLALYLLQHGAMSAKQAFLLIWQVASALEIASQAGIVHRDIKPENILLGERLEVKVADFGLVRIEDHQDQELQLTKIGVTLGTPLYMSPEQAEGKTLDHRSDIYSLGITSYHALAGHPPFRGETPLSVAIQHLKTQAEPLELIRPDIPSALARIVHQMMAKSPNDRYPSLRQLKMDLKRVHTQAFRDETVTDTLTDWETMPLDVVDSSLLAITERLQKTMVLETQSLRKQRRFWSFSTVALLVLFFLGAYVGFQREPPSHIFGLEQQAYMIPKMETIQQQWAVAASRQTPEAWNAVIDFFSKNAKAPKEQYWKDMARKQLAWYYFTNNQPACAKPYFQIFANAGTAQPENSLFGVAGLLWVSAEQANAKEIESWKLQLESVLADNNQLRPDNEEMVQTIINRLNHQHKLSIPPP